MPRGCRSIVVALVGWLTVASSQPKDDAQKPQPQANADVAQAAPPAPNYPTVNAVNPSKYKPPCGDPQDHDQCDLEAQWKAANAANRAAWWAVIQAWLSLAGVLGLLYSLVLTRRATKLAMDASQDADAALLIAERNAEAAAEQVAVAKDTASKQLRAYIGTTEANAYFVGSAAPRVVICLKNFGQTPAFDVVSFTSIFIDTHLRGDQSTLSPLPGAPTPLIIAIEFGIVEPGAEPRIFHWLPKALIKENIDGLRDGTLRLFTETAVQYRDIDGIERRRTFTYYLQELLHSRDGKISMNISARRNESTHRDES